MSNILERLRGNVVVSCQPVPNGALDTPEIVAAFACAAISGGAAALRIEGLANLLATRAACQVPIIGLIKRDLSDSPVRITPFVSDVRALAKHGANIVAFDATDRVRPTSIKALIDACHSAGAVAMADCANIEDAKRAITLGAEIIGTTLSGYTGNEAPVGPDLDLVQHLSKLGRFVIAEGRYNTPDYARMARNAGADALVVGSAITRPEHITDWFVQAFTNANGA